MTINRRIRIIPEVLISCVLATGSLVFWSSLTVECGIRGAKAAWEASQSAYMMTILFEQRMLTGDKRSLKQWEKHCELLGSIIDHLDKHFIDSGYAPGNFFDSFGNFCFLVVSGDIDD